MGSGGLVQRFRGAGGDRPGEHLAKRPVGLTAGLEAAAAQHHPTLGPGLLRYLRGHARGADAGRAGQEEQRAAAAHSAVERQTDVETLLLTVHEAVRRRRCPRRLLDLAWRRLVQPPAVRKALQLVAAAK